MSKFPRPDGVVFDCDSTLSSIEGIDELAALKDCRTLVEALTHQAMNGEVPLESVYTKRLEIIRPHQDELAQIAQLYCDTVTEGAKSLIQRLLADGIRVAIVSGGLREAILPLAHYLGVSDADVFAVDLAFDGEGNYQSVVPSPLITAQGKFSVVQQWKTQHQLKCIYMIGDGMSDVAAKGETAANWVIGYGGVVARDAVRQAADYFLLQQNLLALLELWRA